MKTRRFIEQLPPALGRPLGHCRRYWLEGKKIRKLRRLRSSTTPTGYTLKSFDEYRCIFVHVPKCAGVSICRSLFGNLAGGHQTLATYQRVFGAEEFDSWFKFAFVRNPWDRLVSTYYFLKRGGFHEGDRRWSEQHLADCPDFESFVRERLRRRQVREWEHFLPQHHYLECLDGHQALDFIGRYENLAGDFRRVSERLGIDRELQFLNAGERREGDYRDCYTAETLQIVAEFYAEDIRRFGYDFDDGAGEPAAGNAHQNSANSTTPSTMR